LLAAIIGDAVACCHRPGARLGAQRLTRETAPSRNRCFAEVIERPTIAPKVAMMDGGIGWPCDRLAAAWQARSTGQTVVRL
jgi:hypothetical protein